MSIVYAVFPVSALFKELFGHLSEHRVAENVLVLFGDYFQTLRQKYLKSGQLDPKVMGVDANTLLYQVPGGMLSNLVSQLKPRPEV